MSREAQKQGLLQGHPHASGRPPQVIRTPGKGKRQNIEHGCHDNLSGAPFAWEARQYLTQGGLNGAGSIVRSNVPRRAEARRQTRRVETSATCRCGVSNAALPSHAANRLEDLATRLPQTPSGVLLRYGRAQVAPEERRPPKGSEVSDLTGDGTEYLADRSPVAYSQRRGAPPRRFTFVFDLHFQAQGVT